jgi:hypothetical protein
MSVTNAPLATTIQGPAAADCLLVDEGPERKAVGDDASADTWLGQPTTGGIRPTARWTEASAWCAEVNDRFRPVWSASARRRHTEVTWAAEVIDG